jgi:uncharacterized protein (TIRG00374 family)
MEALEVRGPFILANPVVSAANRDRKLRSTSGELLVRGKTVSAAGTKRGTLKPLIAFALKTGLALGLLWWLFRSNRLNAALLLGIGADLRVAGVILAGAACVFCGQLLLAARLLALLRHQELKVSYARALGLTLIGSFFGSILPGLVSGDAVRAAYLLSDAAGRRSRAIAAVMIDRIIGLYSLLLLGTVALLVAWPAGAVPRQALLLLCAPLAVAGLTAVLALMAWKGIGRVRVVAKADSLAPRRMQNLVRSFRHCLGSPRLLGAAVGLSLANHVLVIMTFVAAGALLNDSVSPFYHFILDPLAMVMNALPVTPGGIGVTEGAFSFLFEAIGSSKGAAIGLLGRFIQYSAFAVAGTMALFSVGFRRDAKPQTPPVMQSLKQEISR